MKIGDEIIAIFSNGDQLNGTLANIPGEVDELWYIKDLNNEIHAINYRSSTFEQFIYKAE